MQSYLLWEDMACDFYAYLDAEGVSGFYQNDFLYLEDGIACALRSRDGDLLASVVYQVR